MHAFTAAGALRSGLSLLAVALLGIGARAETLSFEARLSLGLPGVEGMGELEIASGVGIAEVDAPQLRSFEIVAAQIAGVAGIPVTDPGAAPVTSLRISASLPRGSLRVDPFAGPFSEPAITHNALELPGSLRICMLVAPLPPCLAGVGVPLTAGSPAEGLGHGGLLTVGGTLGGTLRISLRAAPFTLGTASLGVETASGAAVTFFSAGSIGGPYLFTSSAGQPGGFLSVVAPTRVRIDGGGDASSLVAGFARLELRFLPEPGIALLLAAGALGLCLVGRPRAALRASSPRDDDGRRR